MRPFNGLLVSLVVLPVLATASTAAAQAWVNEKGELSLNLRSDFQTASGVYHGSELVTGTSSRFIMTSIGAEYVPVDKLSLGLTAFSNAGAYTGYQMIPNYPYPLAHGTRDDGSMHFDFTDLLFEAHYQAYDGPVTIAPLLRVQTPLHQYENLGYAAAGSGLKEASLGFELGKYGLGSDDLVLQAGYAFTFVSKYNCADGWGPSPACADGSATTKYRVNRSDVDLSLAYILSDKLTLAAGAALRITHDGFDLAEYPMLPPGDPLMTHHDPVLKQMYLAPTAVANYQLNDSLSLSGRFAIIVLGQNVSNALSFGVTLGWATNLAGGAPVAASADASADVNADTSTTTEPAQ